MRMEMGYEENLTTSIRGTAALFLWFGVQLRVELLSDIVKNVSHWRTVKSVSIRKWNL